ncbi:universal stress protein [Pseudovibrio sp. WM33]|uniref:universal stress protein n=1 Tax=Pseudovibrio sp. WM33 TaxID=1735585 RepID=UPI0007AE60D3|nr:universal stress protein [Pseudovibrio sp. WM33]KZL17374.1 Universal stress protein family protein [Pseudovibrio sp. WM33]
MSIKTVVTLTDTSGDQVASRVAVELSKLTDAYLIGVVPNYETSYYLCTAGPMPPDYEQRLQEQSAATLNKSLEGFAKHFDGAGIDGETRVTDITLGGTFDELMHLGRLSDVIVIRQDDPTKPEPMRAAMIEAMVFDTGVATLIVPHAYEKAFAPRNIAVAWDGSGPASNAAHASMSMLQNADTVSVVMITPHDEPKHSELTDIRNYFERHGVNIHLEVMSNVSGSVSEALLSTVERLNADMLVMGGYGHSRLAQYLFGGATRRVLHEMKIPVLMTH